VNKAKTENMDFSRAARREMSRHTLDCGEVQVSASHGVIYLHGKIRPLRGHEDNFEESVNALLKALRQRMGVRDVITDWTCVF
jgi:hypothetical protein